MKREKKIKNLLNKSQIIKNCKKNKYIDIDENNFIDLINLSLGLYKPLFSFCNKNESNSIINNFSLRGKPFSIPILLNPLNKKNFIFGENYLIKFKNKIVGYIKIKSSFTINMQSVIKKIFKTNNINHPGVKKFRNKRNFFIAGDVFFNKEIIPKDNKFKKSLKIQKTYPKKILNKSVAFTTRNICHFGHKFIQNYLLRKFKKLFIIVIETPKNKYNPKNIFKTYEILKRIDKLKNKYQIYKIYMPLLYAGPREAFFQATIINNLGIKNLSIGRDHAGIKKFYAKYDSQKIFDKHKIKNFNVFKTNEPLLCNLCNKIFFENKKGNCIYCGSKKYKSINGFEIKKSLKLKKYKDLFRYIDKKIINFFRNKSL